MSKIVISLALLPSIIIGMSSTIDQHRRCKQLGKLVLEHKSGDYIGSNAFFANLKAGKEVEDESLDDAISNYKMEQWKSALVYSSWDIEYTLSNEGFLTIEYLQGYLDISTNIGDNDAVKISGGHWFVVKASQPTVTTCIKKMKVFLVGMVAGFVGTYLYLLKNK